MKTIGLIGGMSWESTVTYYQVLNKVIKEQLGGLHSAKCLLYSVDFHEIEICQSSGNWEKSAQILSEAAQSLEKAGAEFIVICTNTMHKVVDTIKENINIPILHIAKATAQELKKKGIKKIGLMGTKYTMEQDFYKSKLIENGIEVLIPNIEDINLINSIIYDELCLGIISEHSKQIYLNIIDKLDKQGAEGVILGCTEIGLLIKQKDTKTPLFDTTLIHGEQAALQSIEDEL
ncbi:amino acid racemase [Clostridium sp. SHJSY1]|uniref:aspartate/glutamate racemase family protein n=1 Tax=Clostridium sp. SHJSY1 TaxID=2942483 RepID=UPI002874EAE7|nr:amino acid racemase [Clostridium sp. SHJSY1]MDS0524704.1 amino acid racemase [Clostridium sp. SHJSY1]